MNRAQTTQALILLLIAGAAICPSAAQACRKTAKISRAGRAPASDLASRLDVRPTWVENFTPSETDNASYLANQKRKTPSNEVALMESIFADDKLESELRQQYQALVIANEAREHHDMTSLENEQARADSSKDFAQKVFSDTRNYHLQLQREKLRAGANRIEGVDSVKRPLSIAAGLAAVYQGQAVDVNAPGETQVQFQMNHDEKYRLSLSRGLPIWDLTSGVGFGSTSQTLTASVGKQLTEQIRADVGSSKSLRDGGPSNHVKFSYDIRF